MAKTSRLNADTMFQKLIGQEEPQTEAVVTSEPPAAAAASKIMPVEEKQKSGVGRKAKVGEKKTFQKSIYMTDSEHNGLRLQAAMGEKEIDRSAIARFGIDIALGITSNTYCKIKEAAASSEETIGEIAEAAFRLYFENKEK